MPFGGSLEGLPPSSRISQAQLLADAGEISQEESAQIIQQAQAELQQKQGQGSNALRG